MSSNKLICGGCRKVIEDRRYLKCHTCKEYYDLECANVSEGRFYNTLTKEYREKWTCVLCKSMQPKQDNTNTPVHGNEHGITLRRGAAVESPTRLDMSVEEMPMSNTSQSAPFTVTDFQALVMELQSFKEEIREELRANRTQMARINDTLASISVRVSQCETRLDKFDERVKDLERRADSASSDASIADSITQLKSQLNERDQDLLLNDVEISCIPEQGGQNLAHIVTTLASKLGVALSSQDIVSAARVGPLRDVPAGASSETRPRPIVVRMARRAVRDELLQAARVRRGATTEGVVVPGPPRRFYINERLTSANRQLFRRAREIGNHLKWRFIWSKDGRIYARQHQGKDSARHRIRTEDDLVRVFGPDAVRPAVAESR